MVDVWKNGNLGLPANIASLALPGSHGATPTNAGVGSGVSNSSQPAPDLVATFSLNTASIANRWERGWMPDHCDGDDGAPLSGSFETPCRPFAILQSFPPRTN